MIAHLSDPHIGAEWGGVDPLEGLRNVVAAIRRLPDASSAIVVTGDIAEHGEDAEYAAARNVLASAGLPLFVLAGNHDAGAALRRHFEVPADHATKVRYAVELGELRMVALDTTVPGAASGRLDAEQIEWLDAQLALAPDQPTLVAMHHPPIATGVPAWDAMGLPAADRRALAELVAHRGHVRRLIAGHVHHAVLGGLAGRATVVAPSTYVQTKLDLSAADLRFTDDPPGFVLHTLVRGELVSHVESVVSAGDRRRGP